MTFPESIASVLTQLREITPARQGYALARPLRVATLEPNPYQRCWAISLRVGLSTILSLDDLPEEQPPRWHASVCLAVLIPTPRPELLALTPMRREALRGICALMLEGIGEGEDEWLVRATQKVLHLRRGLAPSELKAVQKDRTPWHAQKRDGPDP